MTISTNSNLRFVLIENDPEFPNVGGTCWYWDTKRPLERSAQPYIAVQCYCDRDPNQYVPIDDLRLLFTDQAEYYAVCPNCYYAYRHMQWSGSTHSSGWRSQSQRYLKEHQEVKGWCEFCDPIFGNGGWLP
jgi:hypothetical protein